MRKWWLRACDLPKVTELVNSSLSLKPGATSAPKKNIVSSAAEIAFISTFSLFFFS